MKPRLTNNLFHLIIHILHFYKKEVINQCLIYNNYHDTLFVVQVRSV